MTPVRSTLLAALGLFALPGQASAHAHLMAATPPVDGAVAAPPTTLHLTFSEGLALAFSGVTVTGPGDAAVATGKAALEAGHDTILVIPLAARLAPGLYTVVWHALAKDGHKTAGHYTFTVQP